MAGHFSYGRFFSLTSRKPHLRMTRRRRLIAKRRGRPETKTILIFLLLALFLLASTLFFEALVTRVTSRSTDAFPAPYSQHCPQEHDAGSSCRSAHNFFQAELSVAGLDWSVPGTDYGLITPILSSREGIPELDPPRI